MSDLEVQSGGGSTPGATPPANQPDRAGEQTKTDLDRILYIYRTNWRSAIEQRLVTQAQLATDEAKAAITAYVDDKVRRARLEHQREQVLFMAALLREQGGKLEISRKSFMDADIKDEVIVYDDLARNKVVYELAELTAAPVGGQDGEA